jgi:hypothetical protein
MAADELSILSLGAALVIAHAADNQNGAVTRRVRKSILAFLQAGVR